MFLVKFVFVKEMKVFLAEYSMIILFACLLLIEWRFEKNILSYLFAIFRHGKEFVKERFPRLEELYLDRNKLVEDELFIHLSTLKK